VSRGGNRTTCDRGGFIGPELCGRPSLQVREGEVGGRGSESSVTRASSLVGSSSAIKMASLPGRRARPGRACPLPSATGDQRSRGSSSWVDRGGAMLELGRSWSVMVELGRARARGCESR
jgi:hypothetical protein